MYFPRGLFETNGGKAENNQSESKKQKLTMCMRFGDDADILSAFPAEIQKDWLEDCHNFRKFINSTLRGLACEKFKTSCKEFGISPSEAKTMYKEAPYETRSACIYNFKPKGAKPEDDLPSEEEALTKIWDMYVPPLDYFDEAKKTLARCVIKDPNGNDLTFDQIKGYDVWGIPTIHMQKVRSNSSTRSMMFKIVSLIICKIAPAKQNDGASSVKKVIDGTKYKKMFNQDDFEAQLNGLTGMSSIKKQKTIETAHGEDDEEFESNDSKTVGEDMKNFKEEYKSKDDKFVKDEYKSKDDSKFDNSLNIEDDNSDEDKNGSKNVQLEPPKRSNAANIRALLNKKK
jgi:hypothetical protein